MSLSASKINEYHRTYRSTVEGYMRIRLSKTKYRAKISNIKFDLTFEYMLDLWNNQNGLCALTGTPMTVKAGLGHLPTTASTDKICSNGGYTVGNVRFICQAVNMMRQNFTDKEFVDWCKLVLNGMTGEMTYGRI